MSDLGMEMAVNLVELMAEAGEETISDARLLEFANLVDTLLHDTTLPDPPSESAIALQRLLERLEQLVGHLLAHRRLVLLEPGSS